METGRAERCGRIFVTATRGFTPIVITAAISIAALLAILGWQIEKNLQSKDAATSFTTSDLSAMPKDQDAIDFQNILAGSSAGPGNAQGSATTSQDLISFIGPAVMDQLLGAYVQIRQGGAYTSGQGQKAAEAFAPYVRAPIEFTSYQTTDIKTDSDTSYKRMLAYRGDLRASLAPLLKNTEPEYEIFGLYASTKDPKYLAKLRGVAGNYRDAIVATARVVVPSDAVPYHIAILNALQEFAATLDAMSAHADDPFASVALLRTYDQAESDVLTSFNALATYYKNKTP